jgi:PilZ domain-containing protein
MPMLAHFADASESADRRSSVRRALQLNVSGAPASAAQVKILDLSLSGALLETSITLNVGESFSVELPHAGGVEAVVVWNSGEFYGCQFSAPIPPAALSAALLLSPPRPPIEVAALPADPVTELKQLNEQVERLAHKVEEAIERLSRKTNGSSK